MVIGSIIGSGIFLKVSQVDVVLHPWGFAAIVLVWLTVGIVTWCGALALAELAVMFPYAGGPYVYIREAYGRFPAFLWGWTELWVVRPASIGALSYATAIYGAALLPMPRVGEAGVAIGLVLILTLANLWSTCWGASIMNIFTIIKVGFLIFIITIPMFLGGIDSSHLYPWVDYPAKSWADLAAAWGLALIAVMWPYHGWLNVAPIAEDIMEPQRHIPKAISYGIIVVIMVYVGAIISYHLVLTIPEVMASQAIAADMCQRLLGPWGAQCAALGVMCSTIGATNSSMLCGPRVLLALARDQLLPGPLQHLHPTRRTPARALWAQALWAISLIALFSYLYPDPKAAFDGLTDSVILAALIFDGLTVAAVYVLRVTRPHHLRAYRTWGYPFTPAALLLIYIFAFGMKIRGSLAHSTGIVIMLGSGGIYYLMVLWSRRFRRDRFPS
ncbi:MAG: serine/threonine exchanger SteT [Planctomycetaceae bacterium]|nr:MAG: serine/threonine exchanger SteT [Planctomycetaceae bacterium]